MTSSKSRATPRVWQWVAFALAALIIIGLAEYHIAATRHEARNFERERLQSLALVVSTEISQQLQATSSALDVIREMFLANPERAKDSEFVERLHAIQKSALGVRSFLIVNSAGQSITASDASLVGLNFVDSAHYNMFRSGNDPKKLYISQPFFSPEDVYAIVVGKVIQDEQGAFNGYVLAFIDPAYFRVLMSTVLYASNSFSGLVHYDGQIIFRTPDNEGMLGMDLRERPNALFWKFRESNRPTLNTSGPIGTTNEDRLIAFRTITPTSTPVDKAVVYAISRSTDAIFAKWRKERDFTRSLYLGLIASLAIALAIYQRKQLQLQRLKDAADAEQDAVNEKIRHSNELLLLAQQASKSGAWHWDMITDQLEWSESLFTIFGLDHERAEASFDTWRRIVHPEDLAAAEKTLMSAIEQHKMFESSYRIVTPTGELRWIDAYGTPRFDSTGKAIGFAGICVDSTSRHN